MKTLILAILCVPVLAIAHNPSCPQILSQTSQQFINQYTAKHDSSTSSMIKAIQAYQACYQRKTQQIKNDLNESDRGPLMGAQGNFRYFQQALYAFKSAALKMVATGGTYDQLNVAYIDLYQCKFTRSYYLSYQAATKKSASKEQLKVLNQKLDSTLLRFPKAKQKQIKILFNTMSQHWVQSLNSNKLLPYQFSLSILQPLDGEALVKPML